MITVTTRMDTGVHKLTDAKAATKDLQVELAIKEEELKIAGADAETVLARVLSEATVAEKARSKVEDIKQRCEHLVREMEKGKQAAEAKLVAAKPALDEAEEALNTIKTADIATVRKLPKPPNLIMRIMDCVNLLFYRPMGPVRIDPDREGCLTTSWTESTRFMSNPGFLAMLVNYPRHILTAEMIELLEPYMNASDYNPTSARKTCGNVAGLLQWTTAMVKYFFVSKVVIPLQDNLKKAEQVLGGAQAQLAEVEATLEEKTAMFAAVQHEYDEAVSKKQKLQDEAELCLRRMNTANRLIEGLGGEMIRWENTSKKHKSYIYMMTGDSISLAGFLTYMGGFNQVIRFSAHKFCTRLLSKQGIPQREGLDCVKALATPNMVSSP